jgi:hypothetical protein
MIQKLVLDPCTQYTFPNAREKPNKQKIIKEGRQK